MINDPRDASSSRLLQAMRVLGRDPDARRAFIELLKEYEARAVYSGSLREEITGPIVDAMHEETDIYEKTLADGTRFKFLFRTKIARDFLMAETSSSQHVWEPQTTRTLLHLVGKVRGDVLIGGAYFGDHAVLLAKRLIGSDRKVHCFEPDRAQSEMLLENARLNELKNLKAHRLGLWSESGLRIKLDGFDSFASSSLTDSFENSVQTITVDDYRLQHGFKIGLIQLDVEGGEYGVLRGAKAALKNDRPAVVFEVHRHYVDWSAGLAATDICRYLTGFGYKIFAIRDLHGHRDLNGKKVELVPMNSVYLDGPPHGFNMLAMADELPLDTEFFRIVDGVSPKLIPHKDPALHHPIDGF